MYLVTVQTYFYGLLFFIFFDVSSCAIEYVSIRANKEIIIIIIANIIIIITIINYYNYYYYYYYIILLELTTKIVLKLFRNVKTRGLH